MRSLCGYVGNITVNRRHKVVEFSEAEKLSPLNLVSKGSCSQEEFVPVKLTSH